MPVMSPPAVAGPLLYWRRTFPGGAVHARDARRFAACLLEGCPYLDDVLLVVDELAVNAVRHTKSGQAGGEFTVQVWRGHGRVAVAVTDQGGPDEPVAKDADVLAESGRGLRTVSLTADAWGWQGNEAGRTVTAMFTGEWPG